MAPQRISRAAQVPEVALCLYRRSHDETEMTQRGALEHPAPVRGSAMGRGRAKAKQTKVARELKYHSPATDYKALERELSEAKPDDDSEGTYDSDADDSGEYADYEDKYAESDDDERS
jgi:hypothetical protein